MAAISPNKKRKTDMAQDNSRIPYRHKQPKDPRPNW